MPQVMYNKAILDHHMMNDPYAIEQLGHRLIDDARRRLPVGAHVLKADIELHHLTNQLATEMRIVIHFENAISPYIKPSPYSSGI